MILSQYYLQCLSHGSYLIGDETSGQAVVVDPRRDVSQYLDDARDQGLQIIGVINTHFHADFLAGHLELAEATGAWIGYGQPAEAAYEIRTLSHGEHISLGEVDLEILETPGHTWESISVLVRKHADDDVPYAVLTGDTLFIGDVGRPDLAVVVGGSVDELARAQYHSVHHVLMGLPDEVRVYPAHGAGSACGKNLSSDLDSTIGAQRAMNLSVQPMTEDEFVERITTGQPAAPEYFAIDAVLNRQNRATLSIDDTIVPWSTTEVAHAIAGGVKILDTRTPDEFAAGHLAGAINVGIEGRFAETAGMVVHHDDEILLVPAPGRAQEAGLRLKRIGYDHVVGYVKDVDATHHTLADQVVSTQRLSAVQVQHATTECRTTILDVRNPGELDNGVIGGSLHIPLAELGRRHTEVPADTPVIVYCASGWRSSVGASLLRTHGHTDVTDLDGGYHAYAEATA
ncbi:MBL fold metallo-hydrolase [Solicola sp. PLA-1-18]|uniref:MBL fold metallo-hydrolase n=1 Tax=Solicola sp. PLA-1-18 TaxID=3380532 RepID=UPI003BA2AEC4